MRAKKEDIDNYKFTSFIGKLVQTRFIPFSNGTYAQELDVKSGNEIIKMIFPFVKPHPFIPGENRRWNAIEKETLIVSYDVFQPEPENRAKSQKVRQLWKTAKLVSIELKFDGEHTMTFTRNNFVPYERKSARIKYLEIVVGDLDFSFFTTKIVKK